MAKNLPNLWHHSQKQQKSKNFFSQQTRRVFWGFEQLSSTIIWWIMEFWDMLETDILPKTTSSKGVTVFNWSCTNFNYCINFFMSYWDITMLLAICITCGNQCWQPLSSSLSFVTFLSPHTLLVLNCLHCINL